MKTKIKKGALVWGLLLFSFVGLAEAQEFTNLGVREGVIGAAVMPIAPTVSGFLVNGLVGGQPTGFVNYQPAIPHPTQFDAFISSNTLNSATVGTSTGGISDFESFISTTTAVPVVSGVSTPTVNLGSTFTSTETNVGGSIYVPYRGPVFTGPGLEGGALLAENLLDDNVSKERDLKELVIGWTNFLLSVAALLAVIAIVWAGFLYVTAAGDDGRMETAKKIVIWVFIGILLILAAYAIVNTVMQAAF